MLVLVVTSRYAQEIAVVLVGLASAAVIGAGALCLAGWVGEWLNRRRLDDGVEEIPPSKRRFL